MTNIDSYKLHCCGSRGSRSVEGHKFDEFGGFTSCYIMKRGSYALVIDCGTGFYSAGPLIADCTTVDLIITHMHYDHILGLLDWGKMPSTAKVTCYACFGEWFGEDSIKEFMKPPFWPVCPDIKTVFAPDNGEPLALNNKELKVQFFPAPHPDGAKILIITAGEISEDHSNQFVVMADCEVSDCIPDEMIHGCNTLIYDGMYCDDEYKDHVGWGHSTWQEGCRLAASLECSRLIVTHHEPNRIDAELRRYEREAREIFPKTDFARAGQIWEFPFSIEEELPEEKEVKTKDGFWEKAQTVKNRLLSRVEQIYFKRKDLGRTINIVSISLLGVVSLFMTVVNMFTGFRLLMMSTLIFAIMCAADLVMIWLTRVSDEFAMNVFAVEILLLFTLFVISGTPEGFSITWLFLLPTAGLFVFGPKKGSILCGCMMLILIIFFWFPPGQKLLMFDYSASYKLRFPLAFFAFYLLSLFLEEVRHKTSSTLLELKANQDLIISKQTAELRDQNLELLEFNTKLEMRNKLLNKTFGRFLPDEIVKGLLNTSDGFELYGHKTRLTVLQSDIRGFTPICNRMEALNIVNMLNNYLGEMTELVQKYNGEVVEFIGDGIMAIFGAPNPNENHADDAVACAIEMQARMAHINEWNLKQGYEKIEIGIGIHTGDVVVGTIGSEKHLKYDAIGRTVNLGSRIESYSIGGQVLVSDETLQAMHNPPEISGEMSVMPKGSDEPMRVVSVAGLGGEYNVSCPVYFEEQHPLTKVVETKFVLVREGHCEMNLLEGRIIADSRYAFTLKTAASLEIFDDIRIECGCGLIGKILNKNNEDEYLVRYTSRPSKFNGFDRCNCTEAEKYFSFKL